MSIQSFETTEFLLNKIYDFQDLNTKTIKVSQENAEYLISN